MSFEIIALTVSILVAIIVPLLGYLLSRKDTQQEDKIKDIYAKHEKLKDDHAALELLVAKQHYDKPEIDNLFSGFRKYLDERFTRLENFITNQENKK